MERTLDSDLQDRLMRRVMWKLVPFLCLLYLVSYLDRVNISFAALTMNADLKFSSAVYGAGASIFFVGYLLFEVPSNIMLAKFGARVWIARILITWGLVSACMAFVSGPSSFYVMRFLLGVAEAGFFPGVIYFIAQWFPQQYKGRITGLFFVSLPLSSVIGAPLSTWTLSHFNGMSGLAGWQWMFIVEGLPAVLLGLLCLRILADRPTDAHWLKPAEAEWIESTLSQERQEIELRKLAAGGRIDYKKIGFLAMTLLMLASAIYGLGFWMPQILRMRYQSNSQIGWLTSVIYLVGAIGMVFWTRYSDHGGDRARHLALSSLFGAAGMLLCASASASPVVSVIALCISCTGILASLAVFWTIPATVLTGTAAATGIAFINGTAQFSGIIVPWLIGVTRRENEGFGPALYGLGAVLIVAALIAVTLLAIKSASSASGEHTESARS